MERIEGEEEEKTFVMAKIAEEDRVNILEIHTLALQRAIESMVLFFLTERKGRGVAFDVGDVRPT